MEEFTGQLGERAIGVTNLMAKTLNVTTPQLFDMMQKGKLKPEDMLKLADAMGKFAESSAGYESALKNSTSAQARMKNAWQLFAYTVLESGLDEALVGIFVGLSDIVRIATPVIKYLIAATKGFIATAKGVAYLAAEFKILTTIVLVLFLRKWLFTIGTMLVSWVGLMRTMLGTGAMMAAGLNLAFKALLATTKLLTAALMLPLMIEVWRQVDLYMKGQDNWIAVFIGYAMIAIGHIDVMAAKFEYLWAIIRNSPKLSFDQIKGGLNTVFGATNPALTSQSGSIPAAAYMNAGTATQAEAFRRWKMLPTTSLWDSMTRGDRFPIQEMQNLGMGSGNILNVVITTPDGKTATQPIDLRSGMPVTIDLGGAAHK